VRRLRIACVLASAVLLGACTTLGPDYAEPEVAWLKTWQSDLYGQVDDAQTQTQVDLRFWWHAFNDPALNALIEAARRNNPSLRIAGLRIIESRATLGIAGSNLYPQVQQLNAAAAYIDNRENGGPADRHTQFTAFSAGFDLAWELDFWGRFRRGVESAEAGFFASIANQQDAQVLLSAQVASLYYAYRTTLLRLDIAKKNAAIQKRSLEITERLFLRGEEPELDLQSAKAQYLSTLALIPELEADMVRLRNAMCVVLGRMPGALPELETAPQGPLPLVDRAVLTDLPANLLLRRRDVRAAAWQVAAQSAQIGIAEADYFPSITLLGSIGWSTDSLDGTPDVTSFGVGPALSWNLFDHGRIRNNVRLQDARLQQSIELFQNSALLAAQEIDDAAITVVKTGEQQEPLAGAARAAERSLDLANTLYQEGYLDFDRVLDAQRVLFTQTEREVLNDSAHIAAVITMYKAVGGGWTEMPMEEIVPNDTRETMEARTNWGDLLREPLPTEADTPEQGPPGSDTK